MKPYAARTVPALLAQRVADSPGAVAFCTESTPGQWAPVTWLEFAARVERLRAGLAAAGLGKGDRLAIVAPVSIEWETLHHAAMAQGIAVAGMDGHDLPERIAGMVELADITAFAVADPKMLKSLTPARWAKCKLTLALDPDKAEWPTGANPQTWSDVEVSSSQRDKALDAQPAASETATIVFTSGTTGAPKGIAYRHEQVCLAIAAICDAFPFVGPGGRLLCWLPLSNLFQRIVNLAGMRQGAASYLLGDPRRVMEVVGGVAPAVFVGVPRFYEKLYDGVHDRIAALPSRQRRLVEWAWQTGRRSSPYRQTLQPMPPGLRLAWATANRLVLRRVRAVMGQQLRCMVTGSAPTPRHLLEEFHALGWLVLEAYGLSENVLPMAMNRVDDFRFGTVGRPLPGNDITVTEGDILVKGPGVFEGYLGHDRATELARAGYHTTGDTGEFTADGYLRLTGRCDDLLKTATGRRVAPAAIEAVLQRAAGVDQAVVVGSGRKCLVALCTRVGGGWDGVKREELTAALRTATGALGVHERPRAVGLIYRAFSIEDGELTTNLKLRRSSIEQRHQALIEQSYRRLEDGGHDDTLQVIDTAP